jgi:hypothetical protein
MEKPVWTNKSTSNLAMMLTETITGTKWTLPAFYGLEKRVSSGNITYTQGIELFRKSIYESFSRGDSFLKVNLEEVDWDQLFEYCMNYTKKLLDME